MEMNLPEELIGEILSYTTISDDLSLFFVCQSFNDYILKNIKTLRLKTNDFCKEFNISQLCQYMNKHKEVTFMFDLMKYEYQLDIERYVEKQKKKYKKYRCKPEINEWIFIEIGEYTNKSKELKILNVIFEHVFGTSFNIQADFTYEFGLIIEINCIKDKYQFKMLAIGNETYDDGDRDMTTIINKKYNEETIINILSGILYYRPLLPITGSFHGNSNIPLIYDNLKNNIEKGIRYADKEPFYRRIILMQNREWLLYR
jgi:hypothetical protein